MRDEHIPDGTEPEHPAPGSEQTSRRESPESPESGGLGKLPSRDVPEPPNRDEVRSDDDVTPDAGTVEPPD
ncbi:hypothetical protein SAXI111661_15660 [Saccharomonospora xinjiangensis]|uniref:hypothetical protein n=1 Tax=Saccharomonospora xinjiangensis TaxID=75294 RepID=UPI0010702B5D|nr:hypothetical protein [Saccharomonospora xinjiangensis]QBQ61332.1 hypothetical protein EYD13_14920 [Saccharomonospora xinjiangensis]